MSLIDYLAHAAGGCFLVNGIPHFVQGICGNRFQSPFASPPGIGESSPIVNVLWGALNFLLGTLLLCEVGEFQLGLNLDTIVTVSFGLLFSLTLAWHFGKVRSNKQ